MPVTKFTFSHQELGVLKSLCWWHLVWNSPKRFPISLAANFLIAYVLARETPRAVFVSPETTISMCLVIVCQLEVYLKWHICDGYTVSCHPHCHEKSRNQCLWLISGKFELVFSFTSSLCMGGGTGEWGFPRLLLQLYPQVCRAFLAFAAGNSSW